MRSSGRAVIVLLTLAYVGLAGAAVVDDRFLHDEGLLTRLLAALVGREPMAALFLQKARPPLAALYAPVASMPLSVFLWAHVLVAALAVPLTAATARTLGHPRPELAAAVVALSPMFIAAGASGLMNSDAVVGVAAFAWCWSRGRLLTAGIVMGALVWVRAELAVLALAYAAWSAWDRKPRAWIGLAAFPVVYGLAGALYHGDLLWMVHFPPALSRPMEDNPFWDHQTAASMPMVVGAVLAVTPAVVWLGLWRARDAHVVERVGLAAVVVLAVALVVLPRWRVFNFDTSPRYLLPILPFVALAVARVLSSLGPDAATPGGWRRGLGLGLAAALALVSERLGGGPWALIAVAVAAMAVVLGGAGWSTASRLVAAGLVAAGPLAFGSGARLARRQQAGVLDQMVVRLAEHPEWEDRPLFTNAPLLSAYLERSGGLPGRDVRYMVQADQLYELTTLSNPANGQRARLLSALGEGFHGRPVFPDALSPETIPPDAVFVLTEDPRLALVMPPARWSSVLRVVHRGRGMTIAVRRDEESAR
ncbi:MAG: hypothetical protein K0V04_19145 [Deltaproteobacteria bacterium]|nr:hypothetical protein [Deltaproteobacteria bacterium]